MASYDRLAALKEFDESKAGVKGLVDSRITSVPPIFHHPTPLPHPHSNPPVSIATIDLSLPRPVAIDLIRSATKTLGFFQVTNHGIPLETISRTISAFRSFNELPLALRSPYYSRDFSSQSTTSSYFSTFDLFTSLAANWRDTFQIRWNGNLRPDPRRIPDIFRDEIMELEERIAEAAKLIMGLMAEGLGVGAERLTWLEDRQMLCHYYPWCPEPEKAMGTPAHKDPSVVTLLVQDSLGGLQVRWDGEEGESGWIDVEPIEGALIVNAGDLLQIFSNNEYKSVEHRVIANSHQEARVSIAVFFRPGNTAESELYGPLEELVSLEKPAAYRNFTMPEFVGKYYKKGLGNNFLDNFKL